MRLPHRLNPEAREKLAVTLMTAVLFGWITICLTVVSLQIHQQGYGSGITNRGHLPEQIRDQYALQHATTPQQLMNGTSR